MKTELKYTILKIMFKGKWKYFLLNNTKSNIKKFCESFLSKLDEDGSPYISPNEITVLVGFLTESQIPDIKKYLLKEKDRNLNLLDCLTVSKDWIWKWLLLKSWIESVLNNLLEHRNYLVLEPSINQSIDKLIKSNFEKSLFDKFFKNYIITDFYYRTLKTNHPEIVYFISNDKAYIWVPKLVWKRRVVKQKIKDKKIELSYDLFIPLSDYLDTFTIIENKLFQQSDFAKSYSSVELFTDTLKKQKTEKNILVYYFFNYYLKSIFPDNFKDKKVELLEKYPSYKNHVYVKVNKNQSKKSKELNNKFKTNIYVYCDELLNVLFNYNRIMFFYYPISLIVKNLLSSNFRTFTPYINKKDEFITIIKKDIYNYQNILLNESKKNNIENVDKILNNFDYIYKNLDYYVKFIFDFIMDSKKENIPAESMFDDVYAKFKKSEWKIEKIFNFIPYIWTDLGTNEKNKERIKLVQWFLTNYCK